MKRLVILLVLMTIVITSGCISQQINLGEKTTTIKTTPVGPVVAIASAYCDENNMIHVTIRNDGTSSLNTNDLAWSIDGKAIAYSDVTCSPRGFILVGSTSNCQLMGYGGTLDLTIIGPKNQAGGPITC